MAGYQTEDRTRLRKAWVEHAIQLAMQNRWSEAAATNRNVIEQFPNDVDSYNRLGRALRELGQFREAREAYARAVEIDPNNAIAQKNLANLATVDVEATSVGEVREGVDPRLFISETGKSGSASLIGVHERGLLARMAVGDQVYLHPEGRALYVRNGRGETLGQVEPKVAQRLIDLIKGGNKYAAALTSVDEGHPRLIIHETHQHPSLAGRVSFPSRGDASTMVRPYTKESLLKFSDFDEEDEDGDAEHELTPEGEPDGEEPIEPSEYEEEPHQD